MGTRDRDPIVAQREARSPSESSRKGNLSKAWPHTCRGIALSEGGKKTASPALPGAGQTNQLEKDQNLVLKLIYAHQESQQWTWILVTNFAFSHLDRLCCWLGAGDQHGWGQGWPLTVLSLPFWCSSLECHKNTHHITRVTQLSGPLSFPQIAFGDATSGGT